MTDQNNPLPFAFQPAPVNPASEPLAKPPRKKRGRGPARPKAETAPKKPKRQYRARADRHPEPAAPVPNKTYMIPLGVLEQAGDATPALIEILTVMRSLTAEQHTRITNALAQLFA